MKRCDVEKENYAFIYITMIIGAIIGGIITFFMVDKFEASAGIISVIMFCICGIVGGAIAALLLLYVVVEAINETIEIIRNHKEKKNEKHR